MKTTTTRRTFLEAVAAFLAGSGKLFGESLRRLVPNRQEQRAADRGRKLGIGTVCLEGPDRVEVYTLQTWTLVYTAGQRGIKAGGGLRIGLRHLQNWFAEIPQTRHPRDGGYLTAEADGGVPVDISIPGSGKLGSQYFAWQNLVQAIVSEPGLEPGEQLRITFGDRRGGSRGWRVQPFDETHYGLKCYVDITGSDEYLPLEEIPTVEIAAAAPAKLTVLTPSSGSPAGAWSVPKIASAIRRHGTEARCV